MRNLITFKLLEQKKQKHDNLPDAFSMLSYYIDENGKAVFIVAFQYRFALKMLIVRRLN